MKYLDDLVEERTALADQLATINEKAATEKREYSDAEAKSVAELESRIKICDQRMTDFVTADEARSKFESLVSRAGRARAEKRDQAPTEQTPGARFATELRNAGWHGVGASPVVDVDLLEQRGLILTDSNGPATVTRVQGVSPDPVTPLYNMLQKYTIATGVAEYPVFGERPKAGKVAEGAVKPEAEIPWTIVTEVLPTIAHTVPISRQFAEDEVALRQHVEGELRQGVLDKIESEAVAAVAGAAGSSVSGADLLESIRKAMGELTGKGGTARAVLINPVDWAGIDIKLLQSTLAGAVFGANVFGLQVVASPQLAVGSAFVFDPRAVAVYQRGTVALHVTDSHGDNFARNILTLLAEARALTAVERPQFVVQATVA